MPPTLKELALKYLRDKIAGGEWPSGYRLSDLLLSREIGISRTPIREAINQLVAEGLAELRPHEGTFVRTISRHDIEELYELREVLECHCARKAATHPSPELLAQLADNLARIEELERQLSPGQEFLDRDQTRRQREADLAFHQAMLNAADNRKLSKIIADTRLHSQLFSVLAGQMHIESLRNAIEYHRRRNGNARTHALRGTGRPGANARKILRTRSNPFDPASLSGRGLTAPRRLNGFRGIFPMHLSVFSLLNSGTVIF